MRKWLDFDCSMFRCKSVVYFQRRAYTGKIIDRQEPDRAGMGMGDDEDLEFMLAIVTTVEHLVEEVSAARPLF